MMVVALPIAGRLEAMHSWRALSLLSVIASTLSWLGGRDLRDQRDLKLMASVAEGDRDALRQLYDRVGGRVLRTASRILRDQGDAEDIVQETFLEVWRRARQFDGQRGSALTWILTMARSRAINRVNARTRTARLASEAAVETAVTGGGGSAGAAGASAEQRQARDQLAEAMATLPAEQRAVIELAYFDGLSQSEIADRTGDPLGTVKTRIRLGMEKLATVLIDQSQGQVQREGGS